jgi:predicted nucleic acid-binding protein
VFVLDASVTLPWRFEDEATPWTEFLLNRLEDGEDVLVPAHWPLEVANALLIAQRRRRVTSEQILEFLDDLAALPIRIDSARRPDQWAPVLALAQRHHLTVYDAAYLELAQRTGLPLATLDGDLRKAALAERVALVETA